MSSPTVSQFTKLPQRIFDAPLVDENGRVRADGVWGKLFQLLATPRVMLNGSHSERAKYPASSFAQGSSFIEGDRLVTYVASGKDWVYSSGVMQTVQNALPTDLGLNDIGFLAEVNDFAHLLQWTGAGWTWGPGEAGSNYYAAFHSAPSPLTGWHAADGATEVPRLLSDGTLGFATLATIAGSWYRQ